ncbi:5'-methylthioadenosine/S-adenosylhomocysteine nucleosidase [Gallibacterium salpingitidis]|uniref:5'-methylthioadenosine/S-adenosylhomocysteine nucleosidase n=1 Tax=Gallibacterium salpingitidis TaxID=505341 RepID=A0A1A7NV40_9PAST|nr:5'-methylthioadenosine/S-adenosylhomocysteine nucleosidase [Gallibacterium salpingitidis]OBW92874.1 5'-methylthioadenosine nucleosidase [Gallibacterium salpingitidis]
MKIGIVGAMAQEVEILQGLMQNKQVKQLATCTIYEGKIGQHDVALLQSGIGKSAAAMGTTALILTCQPDCIINTGSAGGLNPQLNIGDIIISDQVCYHDADVTAFGYAKGQLPACPEKFSADQKLIDAVTAAVTEQGQNAVIGLVCSGDQFINGEDAIARIRQDFPTVAAVEMEAAAIAHICYAFKVPFVVIRAISDVADKQSHMSFDEFLPIAVKHSSKIVLATLEKLVN